MLIAKYPIQSIKELSFRLVGSFSQSLNELRRSLRTARERAPRHRAAHLKRAPAAPVGSNSKRRARLPKHWSVYSATRTFGMYEYVHRCVSAAWRNGRHTCSPRTQFTGFTTRRALEPPEKYQVSARQTYTWNRVIARTHHNDYLRRR